jgi:preprotein translocase SecE subunit
MVVANKKTTPKKRQLKPAETVREKATRASDTPVRKRHIRSAAKTASKPLGALFRVIARALKPFRFVLWPFKTRPARAIGRFLASVLLLRYFRDSWKELKLVTWPNARTTVKLTLAVFIFAIFFSLLISVVDYGLDRLFKALIIK